MKGLIISTDNLMSVEDFPDPYYRGIEQAVGGWMEIVHPQNLPAPFCMVVNEEGLLRKLPLNIYGTMLYGTAHHGNPIVGNIVLLKEGLVNGELDLIGLTDEDIYTLGIMATVFTANTVKWKKEAE